MKKHLLGLLILVCGTLLIYAESTTIEIPIVSTGDAVTDTLWNDMDTDDEADDTITAIVTYYLSSDDAEEIYSWSDDESEIDDLFDDDLDAGWEPEEDDQNIVSVGLRFQNVTVPQGATIESAYIILTSHEDKDAADTSKLTIKCEATDNAATYTDNELFTTRDLTSGEVKWTVTTEWVIWEQYQTPELKTIVQEVINRTGWSSGNALSFIFQGEDQGVNDDADNAREFESFENIADPLDEDHSGNPGDGRNHPERVPKLVISYDASTTTTGNVSENQNTIYPNPVTNGKLNIVLEKLSNARVTITNQTGQIVGSFNLLSENNILDVNHFQKGLYFINIVQENKTVTQKIVIE